MKPIVPALFAALVLAGCDLAPDNPVARSDKTVDGVFVTAGDCFNVTRPRIREKGSDRFLFLPTASQLATLVVSEVSGFLKRQAERGNLQSSAYSNLTVGGDLPDCVRLYRVTDFPADDGTLLLGAGTGDTPRVVIRGPGGTETQFPVEKVAFFIEAQILDSRDGSAISYDPVYLWFGAVGQERVLGSNGTRNLVVQFSLAPPAEKVNLAQGAGGAILLGDVATGTQMVLRQTFDDDPTRLVSVWQASPKIGETRQPLVLRALLTETRDESAALRLLGEAVSNIKVE